MYYRGCGVWGDVLSLVFLDLIGEAEIRDL